MKSSYSTLIKIKASVDQFATELPALKISYKLKRIVGEIDNIVTNSYLTARKIRKINQCLSGFARDLHDKGIYNISHEKSNLYSILKASAYLKNELIQIHEGIKDSSDVSDDCKEEVKSLLFTCSRIYLSCVNEIEPITNVVDANEFKQRRSELRYR